MLFIIALIFACIFIYFLQKPFKKYSFVFFSAALAVTVFTSIFDFRNMPDFFNYVIGLFTSGVLGTAFWCVVMWTGALPNGSKLIKVLMPIRAELSILAAIFTLSHTIYYGKSYFFKMFSMQQKFSTFLFLAFIVTIILLAIMLPLTIISFPKIRKKMNPKLWKNIQKTAYIFYTLIYVHVMTVFVPRSKAGHEGYLLDIIVYSLIFIGYAVFRIRKWYVLRKKPTQKKFLNAVCSGTLALGMFFAIFLSAPVNKTNPDVSAENEKDEKIQSSLGSETSAEIVNSSEKIEMSNAEEKEKLQTETKSTQPAASEPSFETKSVSQTTTATQESISISATQIESLHKYKDGTYSASAYGYDGEINVTVIVKNGVIALITGETKESDPWYYEQARDYVIPQILSSQNYEVDAVSGATYSSKAIMDAVKKALESAKN